MGATAFFTISARNYLAFAFQLGESVLRHHPDATFTVWLLDPGELPQVPSGIDVRPIDEALSADELERLGFYYEVLELATAVKPRCFRRLFEDGAARVLYIDPDIEFFRPLSEVLELLDGGAPIVLTPHVMAPLGRDEAKPDDLELLGSGIYNLGFLALARGEASDELLDWWWGWLRTQCFSDKSRGTFTDQKWMNFAPLFWPEAAILRDTSYNVAYWNLSQRELGRDDTTWSVDGRPLTFFHFSGFDPETPGVLSKHQTRIDVRKRSPLAAILERYATQVLERGHRELRRTPFPEVRFSNGLPVDPIVRRVYREAVEQGVSFARPAKVGVGSFFSWLGRPVFRDLQNAHPRPLTRYLLALYEMRPDVRQVYPDVYGADREGFLAWAREKAVPELGAAREMLDRQLPPAHEPPPAVESADESADDRPAAPASAPPPDSSPSPRVAPAPSNDGAPTVNLAGYLRAALGIGEAARGYARAMRDSGLDVHLVDTTNLCSSPRNDTTLEIDDDPGSWTGEINVIHVNADQLLSFRDEVGPGFFAGRYNIGIWAWETQEFPPDWHDRFPLLDEIWVGSSFIAEAIAPVSPVPVVRIPHMVELPDVEADRGRFGLPDDEFLFLFYFDFHSTPARKNPEGTLEAFRRAFRPDEPVRLVLKSINGRSRPRALEALKRAAEGLRVTFIDEALDSDDRYRLLRSCDAFVSLHRAEGFGLGMAEAMAYGMPVVATGWSGNMDFMNGSNSLPVRFELVPLQEDDPPYPAGTLWALADVDHAAESMRRIHEDREFARTIGDRAREAIVAGNSPRAVGDQILRRLEVVRGLPVRGRVAASGDAAPAPPYPTASAPRSIVFRGMRACFRLVVRITPPKFHPRLARWSAKVRRVIPV